MRLKMKQTKLLFFFLLFLSISAFAKYDDSENHWFFIKQNLYIDTNSFKKLEETRYIQVLSKIENGSQELFYLQLVDCEHQRIGIQRVVRTENKEFIYSASFWNDVKFKPIKSNLLKEEIYQFVCKGIEA